MSNHNDSNSNDSNLDLEKKLWLEKYKEDNGVDDDCCLCDGTDRNICCSCCKKPCCAP